MNFLNYCAQKMASLVGVSVVVFLATLHFGIFAHGSGGSDKGGVAWLSVGGGSTAMQAPTDTVNITGMLGFMAGFETRPLGPFYFTMGLAYLAYDGDLDYDFTGDDDVQYEADDVDFSSAHEEYFAGVGIRIINAKYFKFFVGGGGVAGSADYKYEADTNSTIVGLGSMYATEQKSVNYAGYYGNAGFDIIFGSQYGLRFAGRFSEVRTERILALAKTHLRYQDSMGYLAFIKVL